MAWGGDWGAGEERGRWEEAAAYEGGKLEAGAEGEGRCSEKGRDLGGSVGGVDGGEEC